MPNFGPKQRDTKSYAGSSDRAVTTAISNAANRAKSGLTARTALASLSSSIHPMRPFDTAAAAMPSASSRPATAIDLLSKGRLDLGIGVGDRDGISGEVELHPVAPSRCGKRAAARLELRRSPAGEGIRLPEDVRAGQRRVAAQVDLDGGREPAQLEVPRLVGDHGPDERGLGEVHLGGHGLHPRRVRGRLEEAHRGRVAGEGAGRERVHMEKGRAHDAGVTR